MRSRVPVVKAIPNIQWNLILECGHNREVMLQ